MLTDTLAMPNNFSVEIQTTDNRGQTPEEVAHRCVNKIIGITDPQEVHGKLEKELKYLEKSTYMEARDMNILNKPFSIRNLIQNSKKY